MRKKQKTNNSTILFVLLVFLSSCAPFHGKFPGYIKSTESFRNQYEVLGRFDVSARRYWGVFTLVKLHEPNIEELTREEIARLGGDAAIEVEIESEFDGWDMLLIVPMIFTLFGSSRDMHITGTVIKYRNL